MARHDEDEIKSTNGTEGEHWLANVPEEHRGRGMAAGTGATVGAVLGSLIAGPFGAAVGGALGAMAGVAVNERVGG